MRVLVCGGRDFGDRARLFAVLDSLHFANEIDLLIHGSARGADLLAEAWAKEREVPYLGVPAKWRSGSKGAGPARNHMMLKRSRPELVVAFPGGRGTADMIRRAESAGGVKLIKLD